MLRVHDDLEKKMKTEPRNASFIRLRSREWKQFKTPCIHGLNILGGKPAIYLLNRNVQSHKSCKIPSFQKVATFWGQS
jgi:hypothetical protein